MAAEEASCPTFAREATLWKCLQTLVGLRLHGVATSPPDI